MNAWDFGGSARFRYEIKDGFAISGVPGSADEHATTVTRSADAMALMPPRSATQVPGSTVSFGG